MGWILFLLQGLQYLKEMSDMRRAGDGGRIYAQLVIDEMHIKKHIQFDGKVKKHVKKD